MVASCNLQVGQLVLADFLIVGLDVVFDVGIGALLKLSLIKLNRLFVLNRLNRQKLNISHCLSAAM